MLKHRIFILVVIVICLFDLEFCYNWCNGTKRFSVDGSCYTHHPTEMSWYNAKEYCKRNGSVLSKWNSHQELQLTNIHIKKEIWLGAYEAINGEFVWVINKETFNFVDFLPFHTQEKSCVHLSLLTPTFGTSDCTTTLSYVCMITGDVMLANSCIKNNQILLNGTCFTLSTDAKTWWDAKNACEMNRAVLATIKFKDQMHTIMLSIGVRKVWIGAKCLDESKDCKWIATNESLSKKSPLAQRKISSTENQSCLYFIKNLGVDSDDCTKRKEVVCMDLRMDSMFIKEFFMHDTVGNEGDFAIIKNGTSLNLTCTVKTNNLPNNLTITRDGGSPLMWQENTTSLSLVIRRVYCQDIGEYTCEQEDIVTRRMEKVIFPVWVQDCAPVLCKNQPKIFNISDGQVSNWSMEVCFRYPWHENVYKIELFLLRNSTRIQMEHNLKYVYTKLERLSSFINLYYTITLLKASSADVGEYEMNIYFYGDRLVTYNSEIIVDVSSVHQDYNSLPLQLGLPIIISVFLLILGGLILRHILKKEGKCDTGKESADENNDQYMEYYDIIEDKDCSFKINEESSKSFIENQKKQIITERCTESCKSNVQELGPELPPRSRSKSENQQLERTQDVPKSLKLCTSYSDAKIQCMDNGDLERINFLKSEFDENILKHSLTNNDNFVVFKHGMRHTSVEYDFEIGTDILLERDDYITPIDSDTYINVTDNKETGEYITPIDSDTYIDVTDNKETGEYITPIDSDAYIDVKDNKETGEYITPIDSDAYIDVKDNKETGEYITSIDSDAYIDVKDNKVKSELKAGDVFNVLRFGKQHNFDFIQSVQILTNTCLDVDQCKSIKVLGTSNCSLKDFYVTPVDILYPEIQNVTDNFICAHRGILNIPEPVRNEVVDIIHNENEKSNSKRDSHLFSRNDTQILHTDRRKILYDNYIDFDGTETILEKIDYMDFDGAEKL